MEKNWFFSLRGNHDHNITRHLAHMNPKGRAAVRDEFTRVGRDWLLELTPDEQAIYSRTRGSLPYAIEIPMSDGSNAGFVHAEIPEGPTWGEFIDLIEKDFPIPGRRP